MEPKYIFLQTVDSALIIAAGALAASIVGGLIAGYFSNRSVRKHLKHRNNVMRNIRKR